MLAAREPDRCDGGQDHDKCKFPHRAAPGGVRACPCGAAVDLPGPLTTGAGEVYDKPPAAGAARLRPAAPFGHDTSHLHGVSSGREPGAMGRIFEVRKHAMFARWNRMAKQFARIGKDITIAVKNGGPDPAVEPGAAARHPERARRQHAEGQDRGGDQARLGPRRGELRGDPLRGLCAARRRDPGRDRDRQPDPHGRERAQPLQQARRQPRDHRQRRVPVQAHGRVPAESGGHRCGRPRALPDRPRARGDGREHRREGRAAARRALRVRGLRPDAEGARGPRHHAGVRRAGVRLPSRRPSCPRTRPPRSSSSSTSSSRTRTSRRSTTPSPEDPASNSAPSQITRVEIQPEPVTGE